MPTDVKSVAQIAMRGDTYTYVDTVGEEENTHQHVDQHVVLCTMHSQFAELFGLVQEGMRVPGFKIIAFFTTARQVPGPCAFSSPSFPLSHTIGVPPHAAAVTWRWI